MDTFATRLQAALDDRNWGPSDLAAKVTVSDDTIRTWLSVDKPRQPKLKDALEVARVLGVSLDYLADGEASDPMASPGSTGLSHEEGLLLGVYRMMRPEPHEAIAAITRLRRSDVTPDATLKQIGGYNLTPNAEPEPAASEGDDVRSQGRSRGRRIK